MEERCHEREANLWDWTTGAKPNPVGPSPEEGAVLKFWPEMGPRRHYTPSNNDHSIIINVRPDTNEIPRSTMESISSLFEPIKDVVTRCFVLGCVRQESGK